MTDMNRNLFREEESMLDLDVRTEIRFSRKDHPEGKMVPVSVDGREEFVLIPLDVTDGYVIKSAGRGKHNPRSGKTGDLYVKVHIDEPVKLTISPLALAVIIATVALVGIFVILLSASKPEEKVTEALCTHEWIAADCRVPQTCAVCGEINGIALEHVWEEATYDAPKTCTVCGLTEGEKLVPEPVYLDKLDYCEKYGKLWISSEYLPDYYVHTGVSDPEVYEDMNTPGHTAGPVFDYLGNRYTIGLIVDGPDLDAYSVSYNIGGIYTTFSGVCSMSEDMDGDWRSAKEKEGKYFDVYGDGKWLFRSEVMKQGVAPQKFSIDVTGVEILTIQYPKTRFPNRIATIFDGLLSVNP